MSFVTLVLLSLGTLISVKLANIEYGQAQLTAQENARLGLLIALGELQKHAGPDPRVTAKAEILGEGHYDPAAKNWTGVWDATQSTASPIWLVTGTPNSPETLEPPSIAMLAAMPEHSAVQVPLASTSEADGYFAWWISDEGLKASVRRVPQVKDLPSAWLPTLTQEAKDRIRFNVPERTGFEYPISSFDASNQKPLFDPDEAINLRRLKALSRVTDLQNTPGIEAHLADHFHDLTTQSLGVLSRTDGVSGLKQDLSSNPQLLGTAFANWMRFTDYLQDPEATAEGSETAIINQPQDLRRLHRISAPSSLLPAPGEIIHSIAPIMTDFGIQFGLRVNATTYPKVILAMKVGAEFWNPYSTGLVPESMTLEVSGLQPITVTPIYRASKTENLDQADHPQAPIVIDPHAYFGDPIRLHLRFDHQDTGAKLHPDSYDATVWGPGRVVYWVGSSNDWSAGQKYSPQTLGFGNNNASKNDFIDTGMQYPIEAIPTSDSLWISLDLPATNLSIVLKKTATEEVLATYADLHFWEVRNSPAYPASEWIHNHLGFQIRLRERGGSVDTDPSLWLKHTDPRVPNSHLDLSENLDDYGASYVWREDISPEALPTSYGETLQLSQQDQKAYLFQRSPTSSQLEHRSSLRDLPLFELPRQPLISLGSLQHLQVGGYPPFAYGNSWGGTLNTVFDRYYFSGLQPGISEPNLAVAARLPNPRLLLVNPDPARFDSIDTQELIKAGGNTALFFLTQGAFNLNSTSAIAWEALLASNALKAFSFVDRDEDLMDAANTDETDIIDSIAGEAYSLPPTLTRFPQSLQEHFQRNIETFKDPAREAPYPFYQQAFKVLAERTDHTNTPEDYAMGAHSLAKPIAEEIARRIQARGRPFFSIHEFLSPLEPEGPSLLEAAFAAVPEVHQGKILKRGALTTVPIEERTPGYLSQAVVSRKFRTFD